MVPHLWVPLEGAEEQIKTVHSHLFISPSLDSVVFFFACLLLNTQATKLFSSCSWAVTACTFPQPISMQICNSFQMHAKGHFQFVQLYASAVSFLNVPRPFIEKIFLRKALTESLVKAQHKNNDSGISESVHTM